MILKNIYLAAILLLACAAKEDVPQNNDPADFKQFGIPYAGVPDARDVVLYEVNIRAFSDSGDLQGVTKRLEQIKALGFNTIWLMPIHPVGQVRSAGGLGSPYSVRNYLEVNTEFGDLQKLRELVDAAHNLNIAVILDWVANHTSWDNPWMANKSWYTQDNAGNIIVPPGTNWQDVAELNYNSADMRKAMINAMKYWVMEANVDGYRCDAVDFVPTDFWKQALDELKGLPHRKLIFLAEGGKPENFSAGFQMNYAWDFVTNLEQVYQAGKAVTSIFTTHEAEYQKIPQGAVKLRYTTNHDLSAWEATPIEVFGSKEAALSASVITMFTSAAPMIYSGQEVGRAEKLSFFTNDPIKWNENQEMLQAYQKIISVYNQYDAFNDGQLTYYANNDVAIFTRTLDNEKFLILVNARNTEKVWQVSEAFRNSVWMNVLDGTSFTINDAVILTGFKYMILKKV